MDEIRAECEKTITEAREEADEKIKDSERKASQARSSADKKVGEITKRIAGIIMGARR